MGIISFDVEQFDRLPLRDQSYAVLHKYCTRIIEKDRAARNQDNLHGRTSDGRSLSSLPAEPADGVGPLREDGTRSSPSSPGMARGRSQARGNSRDRKTTPSKSPGGLRLCREFVKTGNCKFSANGNTCKFSHNISTKPESDRPCERTKSRSPSEGTKKKIPCARFQVGSCRFGDKCFYMHSLVTLVKANPGGNSSASAAPESTSKDTVLMRNFTHLYIL